MCGKLVLTTYLLEQSYLIKIFLLVRLVFYVCNEEVESTFSPNMVLLLYSSYLVSRFSLKFLEVANQNSLHWYYRISFAETENPKHWHIVSCTWMLWDYRNNLIVENKIPKAENLWSWASLYTLEFIKSNKKSVLGSSTRKLYLLNLYKSNLH